MKTSRPTALSGTIASYENPGVTRPAIEPGSPWWETSRLNAQPSCSHDAIRDEESATSFRKDPSQHTPGVISGNHRQPKSEWSNWDLNPGSPECESSLNIIFLSILREQVPQPVLAVRTEISKNNLQRNLDVFRTLRPNMHSAQSTGGWRMGRGIELTTTQPAGYEIYDLLNARRVLIPHHQTVYVRDKKLIRTFTSRLFLAMKRRSIQMVTVSRHNGRIWGQDHPREITEHERAYPKVNVFCAVPKDTSTVTGIPYLDMLTEWLFPQLKKAAGDFIFQPLVVVTLDIYEDMLSAAGRDAEAPPLPLTPPSKTPHHTTRSPEGVALRPNTNCRRR
ncbi:hypothetical protein PR048_007956 [Dryococelus australis]|uniref:Uncharacterized protein n=1 Tax=Dryococelus australis TaxID=614101 RepID=A0ABQ9HVR1_9NEOP|nr:hypothetical protein PR048_007956 [Dryococelus australis]